MGDTMMRTKFNCMIADEIAGFGHIADGLMSDHENELKQVLGDIYAAMTSAATTWLSAEGWCPARGPNILNHSTLIVSFVGSTRELFIAASRAHLRAGRQSQENTRARYDLPKDPNNVQRIRDRLNDASRDIISAGGAGVPERVAAGDETTTDGRRWMAKRIYKVLDGRR